MRHPKGLYAVYEGGKTYQVSAILIANLAGLPAFFYRQRDNDLMSLREEIFEQPAVLQRWLRTQLPVAQEIGRALQQREIDFVFLAARGTSDHAGVYAQYLWGAENKLPVAFAAPSLFTRYGEWPRLKRSLVVGISQSGQSPDVVSVITEGRKQGAATLAITNAIDSPLAQSAEFVLDVHAGAEKAVAATKSYTAQLMAIAAMSAAMSNDAAQLAALAQVPEAIAQALTLDSTAKNIAHELFNRMTQCVVLGRGFNYATAMEWALKLKELSYVFAYPYSSADFQHGPIAIIEPGAAVLAIAPSGAVLGDMQAILHVLRDERKAQLLVLSDSEETLQLGHASMRLPTGLPEQLTPLLNIVPAQLFTYHLTQAKGYDTEAPRGLHKVTRTE